MPEPAESPTVSVPLAEVARIAGVGRAAVSNWRRRHETFPAPIGGTDASPVFSLAEIEAWLHREGKIKTAVEPLERLWPEYEALGDRDAMGFLVAQVGLRLCGEPGKPDDGLPAAAGVLDERQSGLLERTLELAGTKGPAETFGFLLERWLRTHVRQIAVTPGPLAELVTDIAAVVHAGAVRTVLDPACGTGTLLLSAGRRWGDSEGGSGLAELRGQDKDPVLVSLTRAQLAVASCTGAAPPEITVTAADTLRADAHADVRADVVLCNPPANERDWGHAELATDTRWAFGQPPRTESELAWVQHIAAALAPGGVGVMVLPPAVAARRAGRRIRAGLLRAGVLRTVIALPPGAAPPHGVGLHVWVLRAGGTGEEPGTSPAEITLVDTAARQNGPRAMGAGGVDWVQITEQVVKALQGAGGPGNVTVPVIDLLDEEVDLTPARHIPRGRAADLIGLRRSWARFDAHASELRDAAGVLSALEPVEAGDVAPLITVADLERAGALEIRGGQALPEAEVERGARPADGARVLTGLRLPGGPELWLPARAVTDGEKSGALTVTASQDVVVSMLARDFDVHVDTEAPSVLGPQLCALRVDPSVLDPWFLAGCLRAPDNARRAGTHASTTSRVDVRRLRVPRFSLEEQQRYGEIYRRITTFERELQGLRRVGGELVRSLGDLLSHGQLPRV
ncbi:N-6 DNA methylase [Streptomyces sp. NBC_00285]|uniref:N-6 DNA methylase n=1 Tax=Streptomyces sp. NBC_00285 TaxID=2975700 RepID=UPI002E2BD6A4|nr:N-6 DNA methylase [Streptomyces sp. NBC_00285]